MLEAAVFLVADPEGVQEREISRLAGFEESSAQRPEEFVGDGVAGARAANGDRRAVWDMSDGFGR